MRDQRVYLKVKIKSLAEEAKIIRKEESKNKFFRETLAAHRKGVVRSEARAAQLAYSFLRGRNYSELEAKTHHKPDWERVKKLVDKYGIFRDGEISYSEYLGLKKIQMDRFEAWKES